MDYLNTVVNNFAYLTKLLELPQQTKKFLPSQENVLLGSSSLYFGLSFVRDTLLQNFTRTTSLKKLYRLTPEELIVKVKFDSANGNIPKEYREWRSEKLRVLPFKVVDCRGKKLDNIIYGAEEWFDENPIEPGAITAIKLDPSEILFSPSIVDLAFSGDFRI